MRHFSYLTEFGFCRPGFTWGAVRELRFGVFRVAYLGSQRGSLIEKIKKAATEWRKPPGRREGR